MRCIDFSDAGVVVNSMEELDELYMTYTALDISFAEEFKEHSIEAQGLNLVGCYLQSVRGDLKTKVDDSDLEVTIIKYPIRYMMDSLDYAVAYHLLKSNQTYELITHLNNYCKEFK